MQFFVRPKTPRPSLTRAAFTLIELIVVVAIIAFLAAITVPAIKNISKGNDLGQAANVVRSMIANARSIAVSQHRMAGIVFFEETATYSNPVNANQTAVQFFVEDYNQVQWGAVPGVTVFVTYSTQRQYLPTNIKLATLNDTKTTINSNVNTGESSIPGQLIRAVLFDANGQLLLRRGLATPDPNSGPLNTRGRYPFAYGDWNFLKPNGFDAFGVNGLAVNTTGSSPGFFLYNKSDYDDQVFPSDQARAAWLAQHSDVLIVNAYTGNVIR